MKYYLPSALDQPPAAPAPTQGVPPWDETRVVGHGLSRVDAYERVSGTAVYTLDVALPDMLHGAIVRCPHAHARVTRVDTSVAERMPGVRAVITASTPGADMPWYSGNRGPTTFRYTPRCFSR